VAFIGWGAIARRAAGLLAGRNDRIEIVGVATRSRVRSGSEKPDDATFLDSPEALRNLAPDIVVEAASREAVGQWGTASLQCAKAFVVCSTSAFAEDTCLSRLVDEAERSGSQIMLPPGALGGIDALAAAGRLMLEHVSHRIIKPPAHWRGTPAEQIIDLSATTKADEFFVGTAREAARRFSANANSAVISALAGLGLDRTEVRLVADPSVRQNCHEIRVRGEFGSLTVRVENRPLPDNPKSSELTALSLVRLIEGLHRPLAV
jgi:aspartate dehydrogenase